MATQHGHAGGEYQLEMLQCKLCGDSIHFNDMIVSERTGKKMPLDEGSDYPHNCEQWKALHRRYYNCRECNAEIYFDDTHVSKNGKHIPLDKQGGQPHQCEEAKVSQVSYAASLLPSYYFPKFSKLKPSRIFTFTAGTGSTFSLANDSMV